jgi:hypothetical protein
LQNLILIVICVFFLTGCAKISHMQELLTLKAYSEDQARKDNYVEKRDTQFKNLIMTARDKGMEGYENQKQILYDFGEPVFKEPINREGVVYERWMYREQVKFVGSEKVYLNFDQQGKLANWEYVPAGPKE